MAENGEFVPVYPFPDFLEEFCGGVVAIVDSLAGVSDWLGPVPSAAGLNSASSFSFTLICCFVLGRHYLSASLDVSYSPVLPDFNILA